MQHSPKRPHDDVREEVVPTLRLPGITLTKEQLCILETCPTPCGQITTNSLKIAAIGAGGKIVRITAGAGSGKTTTLLALALRAIQLGHTDITYNTFTKAAAHDVQERLKHVICQNKKPGVQLEARIIHSFAVKLLHDQFGENYCPDNLDSLNNNNLFWSDEKVKSWIEKELQSEINNFLAPCLCKISTMRFAENSNVKRSGLEYQAHKKVVFSY
jgi:superfamily I DNA/RNA helicase